MANKCKYKAGDQVNSIEELKSYDLIYCGAWKNPVRSSKFVLNIKGDWAEKHLYLLFNAVPAEE